MRMIAIILTCLLAAAMLWACGRPSSHTPQGTSAPPTSRPAATAESDARADFLALINHEAPTEDDIDAFLVIAKNDDALATTKVFTTPESDFAAARLDDPADKVREYMAISEALRRFARAVIDRGNTLRDRGDLEDVQRHYQAVLIVAEANSWDGVAQIGMMTADALRRAAEAELAKLPPE